MPTTIRPTVDRRCYAHEWQAGRRAMGVQRVQVLLFADDVEELKRRGANISDFARVAVRARIKDTHETVEQ